MIEISYKLNSQCQNAILVGRCSSCSIVLFEHILRAALLSGLGYSSSILLLSFLLFLVKTVIADWEVFWLCSTSSFVLLQIEFYGDFDGSFHKKLDLAVDLSAALLGPRSHRYFRLILCLCWSISSTNLMLVVFFSHRWSAYVDDGKIKVLNVEKAPSEFDVSGGDVILEQI